ncbi:hypothetical protein SO694_0005911 [Aureococcus anophagefferens]|uniref:Uncharacterized protein n=1 Tax=Aureococcus anophagefferens TaxID=44056 RepID=A0ABR1FYN8_AURAN
MDRRLMSLFKRGGADVPFLMCLNANANAADEGSDKRMVLEHLSTRAAQEELEKKADPAKAVLHKLNRTPDKAIRDNVLHHYLAPQTELITPDATVIPLRQADRGCVTPEAFAGAIDDTVAQLRGLDADGDLIRANIEQCRQIAIEARGILVNTGTPEQVAYFEEEERLTPAPRQHGLTTYGRPRAKKYAAPLAPANGAGLQTPKFQAFFSDLAAKDGNAARRASDGAAREGARRRAGSRKCEVACAAPSAAPVLAAGRLPEGALASLDAAVAALGKACRDPASAPSLARLGGALAALAVAIRPEGAPFDAKQLALAAEALARSDGGLGDGDDAAARAALEVAAGCADGASRDVAARTPGAAAAVHRDLARARHACGDFRGAAEAAALSCTAAARVAALAAVGDAEARDAACAPRRGRRAAARDAGVRALMAALRREYATELAHCGAWLRRGNGDAGALLRLFGRACVRRRRAAAYAPALAALEARGHAPARVAKALEAARRALRAADAARRAPLEAAERDGRARARRSSPAASRWRRASRAPRGLGGRRVHPPRRAVGALRGPRPLRAAAEAACGERLAVCDLGLRVCDDDALAQAKATLAGDGDALVAFFAAGESLVGVALGRGGAAGRADAAAAHLAAFFAVDALVAGFGRPRDQSGGRRGGRRAPRALPRPAAPRGRVLDRVSVRYGPSLAVLAALERRRARRRDLNDFGGGAAPLLAVVADRASGATAAAWAAPVATVDGSLVPVLALADDERLRGSEDAAQDLHDATGVCTGSPSHPTAPRSTTATCASTRRRSWPRGPCCPAARSRSCSAAGDAAAPAARASTRPWPAAARGHVRVARRREAAAGRRRRGRGAAAAALDAGLRARRCGSAATRRPPPRAAAGDASVWLRDATVTTAAALLDAAPLDPADRRDAKQALATCFPPRPGDERAARPLAPDCADWANVAVFGAGYGVPGAGWKHADDGADTDDDDSDADSVGGDDRGAADDLRRRWEDFAATREGRRLVQRLGPEKALRTWTRQRLRRRASSAARGAAATATGSAKALKAKARDSLRDAGADEAAAKVKKSVERAGHAAREAVEAGAKEAAGQAAAAKSDVERALQDAKAKRGAAKAFKARLKESDAGTQDQRSSGACVVS